MSRLTIDRPSWRIRRRVVIAVLLFCAIETIYLTGWGNSDELRSTIANGVIFLAGSVVMAYVFGVVWNDTAAMARQPRQDQYGMGMYQPGPAYPPADSSAAPRPPGMQGE